MKRLKGLFKEQTKEGLMQNKGEGLQTSQRLSYSEFTKKIQEQEGISKTEPNVSDLADEYLSLKMHMPLYKNHSRTYAYIYDLRDGFLVIRTRDKTGDVDYHFHRTFSSALQGM